MSLTVKENKYYRGDKLQSIEYVTEFIDNNNDGVMYYMDAETGMYTDYGYCIDELQCYTNDWQKVAEVVTPLRSYFKVKILGTTTKTQPMHQRIKRDGTIVKDYYDIKTSIDYKVEELLEGERDGKQRG